MHKKVVAGSIRQVIVLCSNDRMGICLGRLSIGRLRRVVALWRWSFEQIWLYLIRSLWIGDLFRFFLFYLFLCFGWFSWFWSSSCFFNLGVSIGIYYFGNDFLWFFNFILSTIATCGGSSCFFGSALILVWTRIRDFDIWSCYFLF